ncbi:hypothetical protein, partial [Methylosinus sp. R-45379]|uniref:hypothetical protein n=1 Tax=Methylosinus sp. R-45379 TaxID=980563 RepID=UPI001AECEE74
WGTDSCWQICLMTFVWFAGTISFLRLAVATHVHFCHKALGKHLASIGTHTLKIYLAQSVVFTAASVLPPFPLSLPMGYLIAAALTASLIYGIPATASKLITHPAFGAPRLWRWRGGVSN